MVLQNDNYKVIRQSVCKDYFGLFVHENMTQSRSSLRAKQLDKDI